MTTVKGMMALYIVLTVVIFLRVSRLNRTFFNSFTVLTANTILIRLVPFLLSLNSFAGQQAALKVLIWVFYISLLSRYLGYGLFRQAAIPLQRVSPQKYAFSRYPGYLLLSVLIMTGAFLVLGMRGAGVSTWLFNTRYAYMVGRKGNGIWYILFQLFIIIAAVFYLCGKKSRELWRYIPYGVFLLAAYLTGSKGFLMGVFLLFLFYYDRAIRRIPAWVVALVGIIGLWAVIVLLRYQSDMSLTEYSDYYEQFLKFIQYRLDGKWEYTMGKLSAEQQLWTLIPRALYSGKPYVYGETRIAEIFFGKETIEAGNTPSFSEFILPYADFGLVGVAISGFLSGVGGGLAEKYLTGCMERDGVSVNAFFLYTMIFIISPVNFSIVYFAVFFIAIILLQKLRWSDKKSLRVPEKGK